MRIDESQDERRIGDRRVHSAMRIAGGSRDRARALGSHVKKSGVIHPCDAAAAGAHALDIHGRKSRHVAKIRFPDPGLARPGDPRFPNQGDVVAGPSRVRDDDRVGTDIDIRIVAPRDRRHGRARLDRVDGSPGNVSGIACTALRGHDQQPALKTGILETLVEIAKVTAHQRFQRGVNAGRRGATVLAQRRVQFMGQGVGDTGQMLSSSWPILCSCTGFRIDHSRQIPTASTSGARARR